MQSYSGSTIATIPLHISPAMQSRLLPRPPPGSLHESDQSSESCDMGTKTLSTLFLELLRVCGLGAWMSHVIQNPDPNRVAQPS